MNNIIWHSATVTRARRESQNNHKGIILWFTGLSGSGKSTLAHAIEERLHQLNCRTFVLDGDNIRHGLCSDLGFDDNARKENIRRISEVAKLMMEAGIITLTAFISPFRSERENARKLFPHGEFIEIYCDCSLEVCEQRDPKGLYQKARDGVIPHFTGISSPYEAPERMEAIIKTDELAIEESVEQIMKLLYERGIIKNE
jgi:adenylylsulfate kinase